jgi:glycosyltransferase involved in cell wall biosynthesis
VRTHDIVRVVLRSRPREAGDRHRLSIVMALENNPYPQDVRVRNEAEALVANGHAVAVLAPRGAGQARTEFVRGVRVRRFRLPAADGVIGIAIEYAVAFVQLGRLLIAELLRGAEVIHLHNPPDFLFPVAGLARASGRAVIFDHHDLAPELFEQRFGEGWMASLLRWCERMTLRVANVVLAANESHRSVAIGRGHVDRGRVVVVRNAPREQTLASSASTRPGVLTSPRLCYVGALGPQDGVAILPEILARLCAEGLDPSLTIAGDGPERSTIRHLAERGDVLGRIEFMGHVSHDQVPQIIQAADICLDVAPGTPLNHQSTMIKIGEYLAAGRPIVTFALRETHVTAGDGALYARCDDIDHFCRLIRSLCESEDSRAAMSERALERIQRRTWEASAEDLGRAYGLVEEALANG